MKIPNDVSFSEVFRRSTNWHNDNWIRIFMYPVSIPLAWFVLNFTKLSANHITLAGLLVGLSLNAAAFFFGPSWSALGFFGFFYLDFVDGMVARGRGGGTPFGKRLDILSDRAVFSGTAVALAWNHVRMGDEPIVFVSLVLLLTTFFYIDVIEFSGIVYRSQMGTQSLPRPPANPGLTLSGWVPSRLSCPIFVLGVWLLTGVPTFGYLSGLGAIVARQIFNRWQGTKAS